MSSDGPDVVIAKLLLDHHKLIVPGGGLMEHRVHGHAITVLNDVLTWETDDTRNHQGMMRNTT